MVVEDEFEECGDERETVVDKIDCLLSRRDLLG